MPRPKQPLEDTYGKLTVLEELPASKVRVKCLCGTVKDVHRSNLRSGKVVSCGAAACRDTSVGGRRMRGPTWLRRNMIRTVYEQYLTGAQTVQQTAEFYNVHVQTVYALVHAIEQGGGLDAYMARIEQEPEHGDEEAPPPAPVMDPAPAAGQAPPPPSHWAPKKA